MLEVYVSGLCLCSVCTDLNNLTEIESAVNSINPTGIDSKWKISEDEKFRTGEPMPCPCNDKPETHKHYLMVC